MWGLLDAAEKQRLPLSRPHHCRLCLFRYNRPPNFTQPSFFLQQLQGRHSLVIKKLRFVTACALVPIVLPATAPAADDVKTVQQDIWAQALNISEGHGLGAFLVQPEAVVSGVYGSEG